MRAIMIILVLLVATEAAASERLPLFSYGIGAAIPAVSIQLGTRQIRFLDSVVPLYVVVNGFRRTYGDEGEVYKVALWVVTAGIGANSVGDNGRIALSVVIIPYSIRVNEFSCGLGLSYRAVGIAETKWENFSVLLPYISLRF